jgi:hypothetical protein
VDGVNALKLVSVSTETFKSSGCAAIAQGQPLLARCPSTTTKDTVTETIRVGPATCLPVRMARTSSVYLGVAYNIRWLPPTRTNLALLTVPIPAGFTQVAPSL